MNYAVLTSELVDDPESLGYASMTDEEATVSLNGLTRVRNVVSVSGQDIFEAVVPTEYNALTADQKALLLGIIGMGEILVNGTNTKAALLAMFGVLSTTRTNLAALQIEAISRAMELGLGRVKVGYVQITRSAT